MPVARVQAPDGRIGRFDVPEGTTPQQAQSIADDFFASNPPTTAETIDTAVEDVDRTIGETVGALGEELGASAVRISEGLDKRNIAFKKSILDVATGEITPGEGVLQTAGSVAGATFDVLGEGLVEVGKGISAIVPDGIEQPVVDAFKGGLKFITETETGQEGLRTLEKGKEAYDGFKAKNPRAAKNIESAVNVGLVLAPAKVKVTAEPTIAGTVGEKIVLSGQKKITRARNEFIDELVQPKKTAKLRTEAVSRTKEVGRGPFRRNVVTPTAREAEVASEIRKIPGIKPGVTLQRSRNIIDSQNTAIRKSLEKKLKNSTVEIPESLSFQAIDDAVIALEANPLIVGNAATIGKRIAGEAKRIIAKNDKTPLGLLKARREIDAFIKSQKGSKAFDPALENSVSVATREIRNSMNDLLENSVVDQGVKKELRRQSLLFDALENIDPKAADEAASAVARSLQNAAKVLPTRNKFIQGAAALAGVGGLGAASLFAPYFTLGAVGLASGIGISRALGAPINRKAVGSLLKAIDQSILSTRNRNMVKQLRADRALVVELLQEQEQE